MILQDWREAWTRSDDAWGGAVLEEGRQTSGAQLGKLFRRYGCITQQLAQQPTAQFTMPRNRQGTTNRISGMQQSYVAAPLPNDLIAETLEGSDSLIPGDHRELRHTSEYEKRVLAGGSPLSGPGCLLP